jgi:WD40 repeat protein
MNGSTLHFLLGIFITAAVLVPGIPAMAPLWISDGTTTGELTFVVISEDGSTIVAGGDQLIALTRDGKRIWSGWSGTKLVISRDGNYILTTRDQNVRLISGRGTMIWDDHLEVPASEVSMTPDASLIAAGGANIIRLIGPSGEGIRQNMTMPVMNHFRLFPDGTGIVVTSRDGIHTSNLTFFSEWTDANMTQDFVETDADGLSFVSVTNNRIRFYSRDGQLEWERALPGGNALGFAYSRDGSTIVVGRDDNTVQALDRNGTLLWTDSASHWVTSVAVSDDGNTIVAGSMDKTVSVYDRAGTKLGTASLKNQIRSGSVAVSGDGSVIAAVDGSAVYGFSGSQFAIPETPAMTPITTAPAEEAAVLQETLMAPIPAATLPAPAPTQKAPASPAAALAVTAILAFFRGRKA